jgi:hypothetical protein
MTTELTDLGFFNWNESPDWDDNWSDESEDWEEDPESAAAMADILYEEFCIRSELTLLKCGYYHWLAIADDWYDLRTEFWYSAYGIEKSGLLQLDPETVYIKQYAY